MNKTKQLISALTMLLSIPATAQTLSDVDYSESLAQRANQGEIEAQYLLGKAYLTGKNIDKNKDQAKEWLKKSAENGYAPAMRFMGVLSRNNDSEAIFWWEKAANLGDSISKLNLGYHYYNTKNITLAEKWLISAIESGSPEASIYLFLLYNENKGSKKLKKDHRESFKWLKTYSDSDINIKICLAQSYEYGLGTKADTSKAIQIYEQLAESGDTYAINKLGVMYSKGNGTPKDLTKAAELFKKSADLGDEWGQYNYADALAYGKGVAKDIELAEIYYKKSADKNNFSAILDLAEIHSDRNNFEEAKKFYKKTIESKDSSLDEKDRAKFEIGIIFKNQNQYSQALSYLESVVGPNKYKTWALNTIGLIYLEGGNGIPTNKQKAYEIFKDLAEKSYGSAEYNLAQCYMNGDGTEKNLDSAKYWFKKARETAMKNDNNSLLSKSNLMIQQIEESMPPVLSPSNIPEFPEKHIITSISGCKLFNPNPVAGEKVSWTGKCVNGYANGAGEVTWIEPGKSNNRYKAYLINGLHLTPSAPSNLENINIKSKQNKKCSIVLPLSISAINHLFDARFVGKCPEGGGSFLAETREKGKVNIFYSNKLFATYEGTFARRAMPVDGTMTFYTGDKFVFTDKVDLYGIIHDGMINKWVKNIDLVRAKTPSNNKNIEKEFDIRVSFSSNKAKPTEKTEKIIFFSPTLISTNNNIYFNYTITPSTNHKLTAEGYNISLKANIEVTTSKNTGRWGGSSNETRNIFKIVDVTAKKNNNFTISGNELIDELQSYLNGLGVTIKVESVKTSVSIISISAEN